MKSGSPNSTGVPFSTRISLTVPDFSASISFISFIASMMHSVSPAFDLLTDFDKCGGIRAGRAVERADHRRFLSVGQIAGGRRGGGRGCRNGCGGRRYGRRGGRYGRGVNGSCRSCNGTGNADFFLAFGYFDFGDTRFFNQINQFF